MRGCSNAKLTSCHAVISLDIGLRKPAACFRSQEIRVSFFFGGGGKSISSLQIWRGFWFLCFPCVFPCVSATLFLSVMPGWFLLFILKFLSFFYWCIDSKALRNSDKKKKSTAEVDFIITKCFMTSLYVILQVVNKCPSISYWYKTKYYLSVTAGK